MGQKPCVRNRFGKIEPGKKPGLLLLQNVDLQNMKLLPDSFVNEIDIDLKFSLRFTNLNERSQRICEGHKILNYVNFSPQRSENGYISF